MTIYNETRLRPLHRVLVALALLSLGGSVLNSQSAAGKGWSSLGILPFQGYDQTLVKAPTQYILYYTKRQPGTVESGNDPQGRAFSKDLKTGRSTRAMFAPPAAIFA